MLNNFFNNPIKSSLFLAIIIYIPLNILAYFHWEQNKNDIEKFDITQSEIIKSNKNSVKQLEIKKQIQNYGIKVPITLIPISLLLGFLQFIVFKKLIEKKFKISERHKDCKNYERF